MDEATVLQIARDGFAVALSMSWIPLAVALGVGVIVSLIQALTQLQESTLVFVPKVIAVTVTIMLTLSLMNATLRTYFEHVIEAIVHID